MKKTLQYYPYFDWLRGLLALVVMLSHEKVIAWQYAGDFAVQVFFALSGWLIGGVLLKTSSADLPKFYFNRAIRIWIPYFIGLAILIIVSLLKEPITAKWIEFILYRITFVHNLFGVTQAKILMPLQGTGNLYWSVNAEEQFYLLAPILLVLLKPNIVKSVYFWVFIAIMAYITDTYASIVLGVLAAVIHYNFAGFYKNKVSQAILFSILLISTLGFLWQFNFVLVAPFASISLVLLLARNGQKSKIGEIIGGMSYPFYLNHWIGTFVGNAILQQFNVKTISLMSSLLVNVAISYCLYHYIDKPCLDKRDAWFSLARGKFIIAISYLTVSIGIMIGLFYKYA